MKNFIYDPSLVLYLPLHMLDGASFMSKDAYGHSCAVTGALWTPRGRSFDGTDDEIDTGSSATLNLTTAISVIMWVKPDLSANRTLLSRCVNSTHGYTLIAASNSNLYLISRNSNVDPGTLSKSGLVTNTWYQVGFIWVSSVKRALVLNGELFSEGSTDVDIPSIPTDHTYIGRNDPWYGSRFKGLIGEVRLYNQALSSLEIQHNYLATKWRY